MACRCLCTSSFFCQGDREILSKTLRALQRYNKSPGWPQPRLNTLHSLTCWNRFSVSFWNENAVCGWASNRPCAGSYSPLSTALSLLRSVVLHNLLFRERECSSRFSPRSSRLISQEDGTLSAHEQCTSKFQQHERRHLVYVQQVMSAHTHTRLRHSPPDVSESRPRRSRHQLST